MEYTAYCPSTINTKTHPHLKFVTKCWQTTNGIYDILYDEINGYKHLRIYRTDKKPVRNYMDLLEIKNDLLGKETIAIEVYPKLSDFKNGSNTYHIWTWVGINVPNLANLYKYNK